MSKQVTIRLLKPLKERVITYQAELIRREPGIVVVHARWSSPPVDLGLMRFEPGDSLVEYFYSERWYNIFQLHDPTGALKGWYCNISRPAQFIDDYVESEDLELDLLVGPDRRTIRLDDEDEFARRRLDEDEPGAYRAALAAVEELRALALSGAEPFGEAAKR